ncbi:hypothetical protein NZD89_28025 (plasmid) [Alicyclobacillus fastidiosus]|uniref:MarR family transcriptional regulator n=1 Tax=Alicyclobacillus fastidiosus TaxID=392011 RepID=A0ABY6ZQM4_9BACL|nr:hypothetical protein [Alicyclobacillus fastidiosus]WAH44898.1 hypothetical protein NZD89_28025 [Alicyclobacillus fastidiosus]GMA65657.1 hypothetical protein GCM10025859_60970 [Alicyclobacillus fastidiosus]
MDINRNELKENVFLDTRNVLEVFAKLGPEEAGMYVLLAAVEQPISLTRLSEWSHLSRDRVTTLCSRLGMLQLGIEPPTV